MKQFSYMILLSALILLATTPSGFIYAEDNKQQEQHFSQAELEQMLAPIALYPDSVLTHILIASTYPLEVIQADRWASKNPEVDAADALTQVESKEWDPSVKALIPFPRILERLSNDLEWTQKLGDAFLQDEKRVLTSIQSLRRKADQAGNLDKMDNMQISREDNNIIIQSVEREVVYVPYYDTRVVYGHWYWDHYQPVYWDWSWHQHHNHYGHHYQPHHGIFSWHPRTHISSHYYFGAFNWHNHHVIVVNDHHYNARRNHHPRHLISHANATRWSHNPDHRRGVAYRTNQVRERYDSNRPSLLQTRITRRQENDINNNRSVNSANTNVRRNNAQPTRNTGVNTNLRNTQNTNNENTTTRQTRLRNELNTSRREQNNSNTRGSREVSNTSGEASNSNSNLSVSNKPNLRVEQPPQRTHQQNQNTRQANQEQVRQERVVKEQKHRPSSRKEENKSSSDGRSNATRTRSAERSSNRSSRRNDDRG